MKAQTARQLRKVHQFVGLFFAPAILFFALSGALQTIGLHESHGSGPPASTWIRWMASVHKDQRPLRAAPAKPLSPISPHQGDDHGSPDRGDAGPSPVPLKAFVVLMAIGLVFSSVSGMAIALTNRVSRRASIVTIALGTLVPVILLFL